MNILFNQSALKVVLDKLKQLKDYSWGYIIPINKSRYFIVDGDYNVAVVFHREFFHKFGMMGFVNDDGFKETGIGESVNVEHLKYMASKEVQTVYFVYPNGAIYEIPLKEILIKGHKWIQKEGTEVYSFSIHHLVNIKEENNETRELYM